MTDDTPRPADESQTPPETVPKEQYYRLAADFENYRRAMDQQLVDMNKFGSQSVVLKMVDVMDHMDQAVAHATDAVRGETEWFKGLQKIDEQFHATLKQFGVEKIETANMQFDPVTMEAVSQVSGGESGVVQSELRAGYRMHGRVIRPARVVIYQ